MEWIKKYWQWVVVAVCVCVTGSLFLYERNKPEQILITGTNAVTVYNADEEIDEKNEINEINDISESNTEAANPEEPRIIKVYITGSVKMPGVYEVAEGVRLDDVLKLAGGATEEADLLRINLAAYVSDTQKIIVPAVGDPDIPDEMGTGETKNIENSDSTQGEGLININTADVSLLSTLPGIGTTIAQYIIDYRDTNGVFQTIDEIKNVSRIGNATFEKIKDKITVN